MIFSKIAPGHYCTSPGGFRIKRTARDTWIAWHTSGPRAGDRYVADTLAEAKAIITTVSKEG